MKAEVGIGKNRRAATKTTELLMRARINKATTRLSRKTNEEAATEGLLSI
jgi:hypothetical protein